MKEIVATITQRGQVNIPAEVRRLLGSKPGDKVAFLIDDGQVRLAPVKFTLQTAFGSVQPVNRPEDFEAIKDCALAEKVEETILEMRRQA